MQEITALSNRLVIVEGNVESVRDNVGATYKKIARFESSLDELNNRMRRNNLIFRGFPERDNESWDDCAVTVSNFVKQYMGVDAVEIERAHRLGQRSENGQSRSIIVRYLNYKHKEEVLKNAYRLKGVTTPRISISEDYSEKIRFHRKKLWQYSQTFRDKNMKVRLSYDKLFAGGNTYIYNEESDTIEQRHSQPFSNNDTR